MNNWFERLYRRRKPTVREADIDAYAQRLAEHIEVKSSSNKKEQTLTLDVEIRL